MSSPTRQLSLRNPRNLLFLLQRAAKNRRFLQELIEFARSRDRSSRRASLERLVQTLYAKSFVGDVEDLAGTQVRVVNDLLKRQPWMRAQLLSTKHLGALAERGHEASRWEYLHVMTGLLLEMKQQFPGLGLGSLAKWLVKDRPLLIGWSGLALVQSWAVLTNLGHLFGTFATERGVLFELLRNGALREQFIAEVPPSLQPSAKDVIDTHRIRIFYYALAAWRVGRMLPGTDRDLSVSALETFFEERRRGESSELWWAYRTARQLAYNRMHLYAGAGVSIDAVHSTDILKTVRPQNSDMGFEPTLFREEATIQPLLDAIDVYQSEAYFADPLAASKVLAHLRALHRWWTNRSPSPSTLATSLDVLFAKRPADWPESRPDSLAHFTRLRVPLSEKLWSAEVSDWLRMLNRESQGKFLVTPVAKRDAAAHPADAGLDALLVDIYSLGSPRSKMLHGVALKVARHVADSWQEAQPTEPARRLWRSAASFGLRALRLGLSGQVRPVLRPLRLADGHVAYAVIAKDVDRGLERCKQISDGMTDLERRRELRAALEVFRRHSAAHIGAPWVFFLGRVDLVGQDDKLETDIDGLWGWFEESRTVWYVLQHKVQGQSGNLSQLTRTASRFSACSIEHLGPQEVAQGKAHACRAVWPAAAGEGG